MHIQRSGRSGLGLGVVGDCSGESGLPLDTTRVCLGLLGCHGYDKGRDTGCCTRGVIERELCEGQKFSPVVLLVITVDSEVLFQSLICPLSLTIAFWIISGGEVESHSECFSK